MFQNVNFKNFNTNAYSSKKTRRFPKVYDMSKLKFDQHYYETIQNYDNKLMDRLLKVSMMKRHDINRNSQIAKRVHLNKVQKKIDPPFNIKRSFPSIKERNFNFEKFLGDIKELKNLNILDNNFEYNCKAAILVENKKNMANLLGESNILNEEVLFTYTI